MFSTSFRSANYAQKSLYLSYPSLALPLLFVNLAPTFHFSPAVPDQLRCSALDVTSYSCNSWLELLELPVFTSLPWQTLKLSFDGRLRMSINVSAFVQRPTSSRLPIANIGLCICGSSDMQEGSQETLQDQDPVQRLDSSLTNNRKDRQHHALAKYGNYRNYYFHRIATIPDSRLSLLPRGLFQDKAVLDLGCNSGKLTVETCKYLGASKALGIDIDDVLIRRAEKDYMEAYGGDLEAIGRCQFLCNDFMEAGYWNNFSSRQGIFDTILLLSITKWLHLHHGDDGLLSLFRNLFDLLPSEGTLVVEPQEWQNYKRAVSKNTSLRPVFKGLNIRPNFEYELSDAGFVLSSVIAREEGGFSRPLMIWERPRN